MAYLISVQKEQRFLLLWRLILQIRFLYLESSDKTSTTYIPRTLSLPSILYDEGIHSLFNTRQDSIIIMPSTLKVFLFSSALLALAVADSCTDCTAVVSTIGAYLSSEESIANQQVGFLCVVISHGPQEIGDAHNHCHSGRFHHIAARLMSEKSNQV